MSSFAQTPSGGFDLSTGNLVLITDVATVTANKLSNLFGFWKGEWFLDIRLGFPFFQYVLVKNPNMNLINSLVTTVLKSVAGVAAVTEVASSFDVRGRSLTTTFTAQTADGSTINGGLDQPYIVTGPVS